MGFEEASGPRSGRHGCGGMGAVCAKFGGPQDTFLADWELEVVMMYVTGAASSG